ncbi:MAG: phosphoribosyltransferase family protein [Bacteroidia bacterium]
MLSEFFQLFFPRNCHSCGEPLIKQENLICYSCRYSLPRTGFHLQPGNPVEQLFWGRVPLTAAAACFEFRKSGGVQRLLHLLKYKGNEDIGREIGRIYGKELLQSKTFSESEIILPVPLHISRLKVRGYNQSRVFAEGLAESMPSAKIDDSLKRINKTDTQTQKSRFDRWKNVETVFSFQDDGVSVRGKRVLLVDDVVTTGATLEACATRILRAGADSVRVACIAATR